jgi:hypothetical protein
MSDEAQTEYPPRDQPDAVPSDVVSGKPQVEDEQTKVLDDEPTEGAQ